MGNTNKKENPNNDVSSSASSTANNKPETQSESSLLNEQRPAQQLNSKEIRKMTQERFITDAKEDFYQGNQKFREANFKDAKQAYHNALDKLKHWNDIIHQQQETHPRTSSSAPAPAPQPISNEHPPEENKDNFVEMHAHHEALAMTNLGVLQFAEGCYHESQDLLKKALERHQEYSKQLAEEQALGAISLTSLSIQIKKDLSLAKHPVNERNLVSQLNEYSTLDAMIADLLNNLAACHEVIGEMADAQKFFEESLQLRMIVYGKESLKVAETMQNLATILDSQGKYVESENYLRQALSIEKKELGEDHIETAVTMNNLGVLLAHLEKYGESRELLERSVQLRETFYGPHNHLTVCARQNLDFVLSKLTDETPKP